MQDTNRVINTECTEVRQQIHNTQLNAFLLIEMEISLCQHIHVL